MKIKKIEGMTDGMIIYYRGQYGIHDAIGYVHEHTKKDFIIHWSNQYKTEVSIEKNEAIIRPFSSARKFTLYQTIISYDRVRFYFRLFTETICREK